MRGNACLPPRVVDKLVDRKLLRCPPLSTLARIRLSTSCLLSTVYHRLPLSTRVDSRHFTPQMTRASDETSLASAWRRAALSLHPDKGGDAARFAMTHAAYEAAEEERGGI